MGETQYIEFDNITIVHHGPKAVRITLDDGTGWWVPWSCVEDNGEDFKEGFTGKMYVAEWFAKKEGKI